MFINGPTPNQPANGQPDQVLLPWFKRLRYALTPKTLYAHYRAFRDLAKFEPRLLQFLVDPTRNAVDGGANRGSYTYFLSRLCPLVYAFEPNPVMRQYLQGAAASNVVVHEAALADRSGEATFAVPVSDGVCRNTGGTLNVELYGDASHKITVPRARLDDLDVEDVGFIKLDVEGHELPALRGAAETLHRDRPVIFLEIMEELAGRPVRESVEKVCAFGYRPLVLVDGRLAAFDAVDPERFSRKRPNFPGSRRINDFIFLPTSR